MERQTRWGANAAVVLALAWAAGCQLVSGADDFSFASAASTTATVGAGGGTVSAGGAGSGSGGETAECTVASECPGLETDCAFRVCSDGVCGIQAELAGAACDELDGNVCDGTGSCVECLSMTDCDVSFSCDRQVCVPGQCTNAAMDGDESDVDCGGSECASCDDGQGCGSYLDCQSRHCDAMSCSPCSIDVQCQAAGDAFCQAGVCTAKKSVGTACSGDVECLGGQCVDGVCCDSDCGGKCRACNLPGSVGSCSDVPSGQDPGNECLLACNGNGGCQL